MSRPRASRGRSPLPPARKRFGQHFLEPAWVAKLVASLHASPDDRMLEIGPGRGALTVPLAPLVGELIAVEIDRDLAGRLPAIVPVPIRVIAGDILDTDLRALLVPGRLPVRVVGNLPYNVSAPILFRLFDAAEGGRLLSDATVMLQHEVAERLVARPGTSEYGLLGVYGSLYARCERLLTLPPGAFRPPPKVTSAVVRLRFVPPPADFLRVAGRFSTLTRGAFAHRRKTLPNAVAAAAATLGQDPAALVARAGLDPRCRPGDLSADDFVRLAGAVL